MSDVFAPREAILMVYRADKNSIQLWRGEVIDKRSGCSVCRTARVPSRAKAMRDGATNALDLGYVVALGDISVEKSTNRQLGTAFAPWQLWRKFLR